jgi:hypothetical protein
VERDEGGEGVHRHGRPDGDADHADRVHVDEDSDRQAVQPSGRGLWLDGQGAGVGADRGAARSRLTANGAGRSDRTVDTRSKRISFATSKAYR